MNETETAQLATDEVHPEGCCCDACNPGYHPTACECGCEGYAMTGAL